MNDVQCTSLYSYFSSCSLCLAITDSLLSFLLRTRPRAHDSSGDLASVHADGGSDLEAGPLLSGVDTQGGIQGGRRRVGYRGAVSHEGSGVPGRERSASISSVTSSLSTAAESREHQSEVCSHQIISSVPLDAALYFLNAT